MSAYIVSLLQPDVLSYLILGITILLLVAWIALLEMKLRRFTTGRNGKSLEDAIVVLKGKTQDSETFQKEMESYLLTVEERLSRSIQGVETIRFNPFSGTGDGGNQSFATAFVNERGSGTILSSMYARDRVSVFAKPIENFSSQYELTNEEKTVLAQARESVERKKKHT